jgi:hypothetical protein
MHRGQCIAPRKLRLGASVDLKLKTQWRWQPVDKFEFIRTHGIMNGIYRNEAENA